MEEEVILDYVPLTALGYVRCKIPQSVLKVVKAEINNYILSDFRDAPEANNYLVGIIEKEYKLVNSKEVLNDFFKYIIPGYWDSVGLNQYSNTQFEIDPKDFPWVNFQKKYEMNPVHVHNGVLSFVLYIKIPYSLEEEGQSPPYRKRRDDNAPSFKFIYPSVLNNDYKHFLDDKTSTAISEHTVFVDKEYEGTMFIFPAYLPHTVTPFYTSDEYRISVSGNLVPVSNG